MYKPVDSVPSFANLEEETLLYWKKNKIFERSIEQRAQNKPWTFLDGPPFVTGMPHYGTLLSSIPKDVFGRYYTMKGYYVRRVWGWDGHGLPIENKVEGELGIKRKRDIEEKVGVGTFIQECKKYVTQMSAEWEWYVDHIGRWVDFKNAYKTWDTPYMESVMWVFANMYKKGYVYRGLRVSLYCPHCSTPISNFEVAMDAENHREVTERATTYKYQKVGEENTYFLAWSTTPWNKIVTPALAVNPQLTYVKVKQADEYYILGKETLKMLNDDVPYEVVEKMKGTTLIGQRFVPHYDYYSIAEGEKAWEIVGGSFVTEDEGTGIVTLAAYGQEDMALMQEQNIHIETHVDEEGMIKPEVPLFGAMYYLKANKAVNEDLTNRGLVYRDESYTHTVAHCWRCATQLFYNPQQAWYVDVQKLKGQMEHTNEQVNWFPHHFKHGRFLKSMQSAPDWNISRNRYWGSPIPVWECENGHFYVPESIVELEQASGQKIADLHMPEIDEVTVTCAECSKKAHRVSGVLDSWIEAGSASFAERHFPFNAEFDLEDFYPPDFIVEYTGQIRAWFYVLHVIGAALYDRPAFKNVQVTGVIMGTDGRKMSKNFKNYPDPKTMLTTYGGDALRLYLLSTPVMKGEDIAISEAEYRNQVRGLMLVVWNVYKYFTTYANLSGVAIDDHVESTHVLDIWLKYRLQQTISDMTLALDQYDTIVALDVINQLVTDTSTWWLRRSRDRMSSDNEDAADRMCAFSTMHECLVTICLLLAPLAPFISEQIYCALTGRESVHLENWPSSKDAVADEAIGDAMTHTKRLSEMGNAKRREIGVAVKQPLASLTVAAPDEIISMLTPAHITLLCEELNVKKVIFQKNDELDVSYDTVITQQLADEGRVRDIVRSIQGERKKLGTSMDELVDVVLESWPAEFTDEIKKKAHVGTLVKGDAFSVVRR